MSHIKKIWRKYIWEEIKEDHENYFITYLPINLKDSKHANLHIVFTNNHTELNEIAKIIEKEFDIWFNRFPLPLMVTAFDYEGDKISLKNIRKNDILMGYSDNNRIKKIWGYIPDEDIPKDQLNDEYIRKIYKGLSFEKRIEKEKEAERNITQSKNIAKFFDITLFIWFLVSIIIAFLGWQNFWVGAMAFIYSVYKTIKRFLSLKGYKTKKKKEEQERKRKMKHYYYHCELNPNGFQKLKAENLEKEDIKKFHEEKGKINM